VEKPLRRGSRTVRYFLDITGLKIHLLFSITLETKQKTKTKKSRVREITRLVRDKTPGCKTRGVLARASLDLFYRR
jgi:hypothetical protein